MDKNKILKNLKNFIYMIIIISFLVIYYASKSGYFDDVKAKKMALTKEQIAQFEEDISLRKEIDIKSYYHDLTQEYDNKFSKLGNFLSTFLQNMISAILDKTFKLLNDFLNT